MKKVEPLEIMKWLQKGREMSERSMTRIRQETLSEEEFAAEIKRYVYARFLLPKDYQESNLYRLAVESIRILSGQKTKTADLTGRLAKPDCHNTSSAVQKKVLLIMGIERQLAITLADEEAEKINTLEELSGTVFQAWEKKQRSNAVQNGSCEAVSESVCGGRKRKGVEEWK